LKKNREENKKKKYEENSCNLRMSRKGIITKEKGKKRFLRLTKNYQRTDTWNRNKYFS
jgi:hypothetical protein